MAVLPERPIVEGLHQIRKVADRHTFLLFNRYVCERSFTFKLGPCEWKGTYEDEFILRKTRLINSREDNNKTKTE